MTVRGNPAVKFHDHGSWEKQKKRNGTGNGALVAYVPPSGGTGCSAAAESSAAAAAGTASRGRGRRGGRGGSGAGARRRRARVRGSGPGRRTRRRGTCRWLARRGGIRYKERGRGGAASGRLRWQLGEASPRWAGRCRRTRSAVPPQRAAALLVPSRADTSRPHGTEFDEDILLQLL
jgi:hypothetical protein